MRVTVQACIDVAKNDLPVGWLFAAGRERLGYRLRWSALNGNSHHRGPLHCMRRCKLSLNLLLRLLRVDDEA